MCQLQLNDIKTVESTIKENIGLKTLLSYKNEAKNSHNNIFDFDSLIPYLLKDCLIEFITEKTKSSPYTYENFIRSIDKTTRKDSSIKRNFSTFHQNVIELRIQLQEMSYVPPFVSYISRSLIAIKTTNDDLFRRYNYIVFNPHVYSYIICKSNCIPYFHRDRHLSFKECKWFFELFNTTCEYDNSPIEQWIGQHYIDKYLRPTLFAQVWDTLNQNILNLFDSKEDPLYDFYLDNFLSLCNLLQESSGILIRELLFKKIKHIYFDKECDILSKEFASPLECFKQCASELIIWNNIISPYIKNLYFQNFDALLKNNFPDLTVVNLYEQFCSIINSLKSAEVSDAIITRELLSLNDNIKKMQVLSDRLLSTKNLNTNYFHTLDKLYGTSPYKTISDYSSLTSYEDIFKQVNLDLDFQLICNRINTAKLIPY